MAKDSKLRESHTLKENYYALLISIITKANASEALRLMGLTEGMSNYENKLRVAQII